MHLQAVLFSSDLMHRVGAFQRGVLQDMVPLATPAPNTRHLYEQWHAQHGDARLPLLLASLPHLTPVVVLHAIATDNMHVLDELRLDLDDQEDLIAVAASSGHLAAMVQLHAMAYEVGTNAAMVAAATHGHLNVVEYLVTAQRVCKPQTTRAMVAAAGHGHLDVVQFLHVHLTSADASKNAVRLAATNGYLHVVQWLHENGAQDWSSDTFVLAAAGGHLNVLEYLHHVKPRRGATKQAMDIAATNGHLHIVQFLHRERPDEGCTSKAVEGAAINGHSDIVEFLKKHGDQVVNSLCSACGLYKRRSHDCKVLAS